jgi:hypothetical protein
VILEKQIKQEEKDALAVAVGVGQFYFTFWQPCICLSTLVIAIILIATSSFWLVVHADYLKKGAAASSLFFVLFFFSSPAFSVWAKIKRIFFFLSSLVEKERQY